MTIKKTVEKTVSNDCASKSTIQKRNKELRSELDDFGLAKLFDSCPQTVKERVLQASGSGRMCAEKALAMKADLNISYNALRGLKRFLKCKQ